MVKFDKAHELNGKGSPLYVACRVNKGLKADLCLVKRLLVSV